MPGSFLSARLRKRWRRWEARSKPSAACAPATFRPYPVYDGDDHDPKTLQHSSTVGVGFPLLIKASAGGGGRGMRVVESPGEFAEALESAKREARAAFGDDTVLLERYLRDPRHIEFQILADAHGSDDSSRRTRVLDPTASSENRRGGALGRPHPGAARRNGRVRRARGESVGYIERRTCEFMLDSDGAYYFLEMNARLQVEHPVTELVYDIDLVQWQLRIAAGDRLTIEQADVRPRGWAIEARIYAEDPANDMLPSTGTLTQWTPPEGPGVRIDAGVSSGSVVSHYYDPMLAKLIVFGADRPMRQSRDCEGSLEKFSSTACARTCLCCYGLHATTLLRVARRRPAFSSDGSTNLHFLETPRRRPMRRSLAAAALLADGRGAMAPRRGWNTASARGA